MSSKISRAIFDFARDLQRTADESFRPPQDIVVSRSNDVLVSSLFEKTRGYLQKVVYQINRCYAENCYDACAVMIRRLLELLIIETMESKGQIEKTLDENRDICKFDLLINVILKEPSVSLSPKTKKILESRKIKKLGDLSAHGWRYNACRRDVDDIRQDLTVAVQDLLYTSGLRK